MKQSGTGFILFAGLIMATLFISCNSGNKVVSSFGKRKYTKGYFFNSYAKNNTDKASICLPYRNAGYMSHSDSTNRVSTQKLPGQAGNKAEKYPVEMIGKKSSAKSLSINGILPRLLEAKDIFKNNTQEVKMPADTSQADNGPVNYGRYNREAIGGLILGIACFALLSITGFSLLLSVPGFLLSLWGLDSQKFHALAFIGAIVNSIGVIALIVFLLVELIVIVNGGGA